MFRYIPSKTAITEATISNARFAPSKRPVGIFLGGTSGIGEAMARQLATQTHGRAKIILLGRNEASAQRIIASFPKTDDSVPQDEPSDYSFIKLDATLMKEVRRVTDLLAKELVKINFIVTTTAFFDYGGREETCEGVDKKMACLFYARFKFIYDLVPLVQKAAGAGETTGITSIFAAGLGAAIDLDDLDMKKKYSKLRCRYQWATYTDSVFQEFAHRYPNLGFYHQMPGAVRTPMMTNHFGGNFFASMISFTIVSPAEAAQLMWWRMLDEDPKWKTGAHQVSHRGEELSNPFVTEGVPEAVWTHSEMVTSGI